MTKPTAHIENWFVMPYPGRKGVRVLVGSIKNHPRQEEFKAVDQVTSELIHLDTEAKTAETRNTLYTLGEPRASEG